jgi:hypothetical protein
MYEEQRKRFCLGAQSLALVKGPTTWLMVPLKCRVGPRAHELTKLAKKLAPSRNFFTGHRLWSGRADCWNGHADCCGHTDTLRKIGVGGVAAPKRGADILAPYYYVNRLVVLAVVVAAVLANSRWVHISIFGKNTSHIHCVRSFRADAETAQ